jgi:hypothetical protein
MDLLSSGDAAHATGPSRVPSAMTAQLSVTMEGDLIIAEVRGEPTAELLRLCQERVLALMRHEAHARVLYNTLEMTAPPPHVTFTQRSLDEEFNHVQLRRAIVVPDSRLALLARIAFGEGDYRVFYNDVEAAKAWLSEALPRTN